MMNLKAAKNMDVWYKKRRENVDEMIQEMKGNDAKLFEQASKIIGDMSDIPSKLGDDVGGILMGTISSMLWWKARELRRLQNAKLKASKKRRKKK